MYIYWIYHLLFNKLTILIKSRILMFSIHLFNAAIFAGNICLYLNCLKLFFLILFLATIVRHGSVFELISIIFLSIFDDININLRYLRFDLVKTTLLILFYSLYFIMKKAVWTFVFFYCYLNIVAAITYFIFTIAWIKVPLHLT